MISSEPATPSRPEPTLSLPWTLALLALVILGPVARAQSSTSADEPWLQDVAAQFAAHFQPEGELVLEWARPRPDAAAQPATLEILAFPANLSPQLLLRVRATNDQQSAEHTLILRVQVWRDGFVLREPAGRGDSLQPAALEIQRFDALRDRDAVAAAADLDLIYIRSVPAGRILTWRDVGRRPLVRRGQLIEVAASEGTLTVTLRAVALADAGRGEIVRVRNPDSRREFSAQVTGEARAAVRF